MYNLFTMSFYCTEKWFSYIHVYICTFFFLSFPLWFTTQYWIQFPVLYSKTLLFIHSIYNSFQLLTPKSHFILPPSFFPLATINLFCISESLFLFCSLFHLCPILDSTYKWDCIVLVFLFLTYFTQYDNLQVHPCCCKWLYFILFIVPYCFANKSPSSQGYGFSSNHVWMWELDCEESWAPKNWCFWTVVLEKTLASPLDSKEIQPVHSKGDQSWVFFGGNDAKAETPVLWPPHARSWL